MTVYIHRHGLRLDIADKITGQNNWVNSQRYKDHFNDMPLSNPDEPAIHYNVPRISEKIDAIYTSPAQRCIETSLIINKYLNVPVIVEYGLMEVGVVHETPLNSQIIKREMAEPIIIGSNTYLRNIDDYMMPSSLKDRFPSISVDASIYNPRDMKFTDIAYDWGARLVHILDVLRSRHTNNLIVGHSGTISGLVPYIINSDTPHLSRFTNGDRNTGVLVACDSAGLRVYKCGEEVAFCNKKSHNNESNSDKSIIL